MTSKKNKNNKRIVSTGLAVFSTIKGFLLPVLTLIAVVAAVLSCFEAEEGSNSRMIAVVVMLLAVAGAVILWTVDKAIAKRNLSYKIYKPAIVRKVQPETIIPLVAMLIIVVVPFYILIVTSLKTVQEANALDFTWTIKEGMSTVAYTDLFTYSEITGITIWKALYNSFAYALLPTFVGVMISALAAYAFAKLEFRGKNLMYTLLIMTMLMPGCVTLTTSYIMFDEIQWTNTALPIVAPGLFGGAAIVMFLREYFMGIPDGLLEAAKIDGAGKWRQFLSIMLPLAKPALLAQFILGFITKYNDFLGPLLYINNPAKYTIQIALDFYNSGAPDFSIIAAASVLALVPMLLIYVIFQKKIISGIAISSGLKG